MVGATLTKDLDSAPSLDEFFEQFQIGEEFKEHFRKVLSNPNVDKIKVSSTSDSKIKIGSVLNRIGDLVEFESIEAREEIKNKLYDIAKSRLGEKVFPEADAVLITKSLNQKLLEFNIPLYCLTSDLEGFAINKGTKEIVNKIFEAESEDAFNAFKTKNINANESEYLKSLRKAFGSKTYELEKKVNNGENRKKPHIPIEILTSYFESNSKVSNIREKILSDFPDFDMLEELIKARLV